MLTEKEKEILDGAPNGATEYFTYQNADGEKVIYGCCMNGLSLDDLRKRAEEKPRTKTEWVKVTDSIFHLKPDLDAGELYLKEWENRDEYTLIDNEDTLMVAMTADSVYRKVETEIKTEKRWVSFYSNGAFYKCYRSEPIELKPCEHQVIKVEVEVESGR